MSQKSLKIMNRKYPQIINLLILFTKKERTDFELFIKSPYFNKNQTMVNLYQLLQEVICESGKKYDIKTQQNIYINLFPDDGIEHKLNKKQSRNFNKLMSSLLSLAKKFWHV